MKFKNKLIIFLILICFLFAISSVSAGNETAELSDEGDYGSFYELNKSISESVGELNLEKDYRFNGGDISVNKSGLFTINGNNHVIQSVNKSSSFYVESEIVINDLTIKNNMTLLIFTNETSFTLNNVKFVDCYFRGDVMSAQGSKGVLNNVEFINCYNVSALISCHYSDVTINNCSFSSDSDVPYITGNERNVTITNCKFNDVKHNSSFIKIDRANLLVENCTFENLNSNMAPAINFKGDSFVVRKSKFIKLSSDLSAGAILGKFFPLKDKYEPFIIEDCIFSDVTSTNDGGAIYFDMDSGSEGKIQTFDIINTEFADCNARFGGAVLVMGGNLNIVNSTFENNFASFEGGAVYTTWSNLNIVGSCLYENSAEKNAGAIYFDKGKLTVKQTDLINNTITEQSEHAANAIYAKDVDLHFSNSFFDNGGVSVYANFAGDSKIEDVDRNEDIFLLNNTDYIVSVESNGVKLNLTKNEIIVDKLPSRFNSSDWGWVSPLKKQDDNDDCWAFATVAALESALLKSTGVYYNLSQNYVQQLQLKYSTNGDLRNLLTGFAYSGLGYSLSWYGALLMDAPYDARGIIADTDFNDPRIHVQDAMIIFGQRNDTMDSIKRAILKYGAVAVQIPTTTRHYEGTENNFTPEMDHAIHFITLVGWDDNYEFGLNKGVWLVKDSLQGLLPVSYAEKILFSDLFAVVPQNAGIAYIFENTIDYHVNYQTDLTGLTGFNGNYTYYSNEFISNYDELIGAVGTYFKESGINYSFDIYVNGKLAHSQSGISEFAGFRTIVLNKYIPVKIGDNFKVVFKNNALPYQAFSRQHYIPNMTFVSSDGKSWTDFTLLNKTVCLKVYTVADDTKITGNKNIAVDYSGGSYFSVKVVTADGRAVGAGEAVKFTIAGKTSTIKTDNNGIAKIKISNLPKKYVITTTYKGKSVKNTVTVKQVLKTYKLTVKKTA
ncbi:lectin like domain-containing protein, partial [Methanobrevibacter sp.]